MMTNAEIVQKALEHYRNYRKLLTNEYQDHIQHHMGGGTFEMQGRYEEMKKDLENIEDLYECYCQEPDIILENIADEIVEAWDIADTFPSYDDDKMTLGDRQHAKIMGYEDTAPCNLLDPPEFDNEIKMELLDILIDNHMILDEVSSKKILFEDPNTGSKFVLIPCQQDQ